MSSSSEAEPLSTRLDKIQSLHPGVPLRPMNGVPVACPLFGPSPLSKPSTPVGPSPMGCLLAVPVCNAIRTTRVPGVGLALHLGGEEPFTRTRLPVPSVGAASLQEGWNLVVSPGRVGSVPTMSFGTSSTSQGSPRGSCRSGWDGTYAGGPRPGLDMRQGDACLR